jgi:hypothetical protein
MIVAEQHPGQRCRLELFPREVQDRGWRTIRKPDVESPIAQGAPLFGRAQVREAELHRRISLVDSTENRLDQFEVRVGTDVPAQPPDDVTPGRLRAMTALFAGEYPRPRRKTLPALVSATPRRSLRPFCTSSRSRSWICFVSAGCDTLRATAATDVSSVALRRSSEGVEAPRDVPGSPTVRMPATLASQSMHCLGAVSPRRKRRRRDAGACVMRIVLRRLSG